MAIVREIQIPADEKFNCSAYTLNDLISTNKYEYWCWNRKNIFGIDMKVKKDSKAGKEITKCLADKPEDTDLVLLQKVIDSIIIDNMSNIDIIDSFKSEIKVSYNNGYNNGQEDKVNDFKNLLNL